MQIDRDFFEEIAGDVTTDYRTDYSGRYMYGATCIAIVGNLHTLVEFILAISEIAETYYVDGDVPPDWLIKVRNELINAQQDSMGMETIYYWPNIEASSRAEN